MDRGAETSVWKSEGEARVELLKAEDDITGICFLFFDVDV
jgi:hypothetical protein